MTGDQGKDVRAEVSLNAPVDQTKLPRSHKRLILIELTGNEYPI